MKLRRTGIGIAAKRWLAASYIWALLCAVIVFAIPMTSDGVSYVTPAGVQIPPTRQTLFEHSHGLVVEAGLLAALVLVTATAELLWRLHHRRAGQGIVAIVVGGCVLLFSLFGFVFGFLSLGLIALFGILSGMSIATPPTVTAHRQGKAGAD